MILLLYESSQVGPPDDSNSLDVNMKDSQYCRGTTLVRQNPKGCCGPESGKCWTLQPLQVEQL